jgi:hypothetical protein
MDIDRTAQTPIVSALQQNRGEIDAEALGRLLATVSENDSLTPRPAGGLTEDLSPPS